MTPPQPAVTRWEWVGRLFAFACSWLAIMAILAVVELYWSGVYRFLANGTISLVLICVFLGWRP